jgi:hypothetical protein
MAEAAQRGKVFSAMTAPGGTTIVAGNVSPVGAAAATILSIYNPVGSGVNAVVHRIILQNISGTPGAGNGFAIDTAYNQVITATPNNSGTSTNMPVNHLAGGNNGSVLGFTQTALTGAGASTLFRLLGHTAFATVLAATTPNLTLVELVDGEIILPPGALLSLSAVATGTTHVVCGSITWEEVQI